MNRFKIKIEDSKYYYWCYIAESKQEMLNKICRDRKRVGKECNFDADALCSNYYKYVVHEDGTEELLSNIGKVYFSLDLMGAGVVAHEFLHATFHYYYNILKLPPVKKEDREWASENEESFCYIHQSMIEGFWRKYWKLYE